MQRKIVMYYDAMKDGNFRNKVESLTIMSEV